MLKTFYATKEEIPAGFESLYTEQGGKWALSEVEGIKTEADITRVNEALRKERNDHKLAKDALRAMTIEGMTPEEVKQAIDELPGLREAAKGGKLDDAGLEKIVTSRVAVALGPVQRELSTVKQELGTKNGELENLRKNETTRKVGDAVNNAARKLKITDTAVQDAVVIAERLFEVHEDGSILARDGVGTTPGITVDEWLNDQKTKRPHWWGISEGGGASGGRVGSMAIEGGNPFTNEHWNMTRQGQMIKSDRKLAENAAKQAGTTIGGKRPASVKK